MPDKKPNVILLFVDDLGYGDVSFLNFSSKVPTPNIDRLAGEGMIFTDMHAPSAVSTPSRYGLLTGRYNWRSRLKAGVLPGTALPLIENNRRTLGNLFQDAGYRTACVGKWHLGLKWRTMESVEQSDDIWKPISDRDDLGIDFSAPVEQGPVSRGFDYFWGMPASLDQPPYVWIENDQVQGAPDHVIGFVTDLQKHASTAQAVNYDRGPAAPGFDLRQAVPICDQKVLELIEDYSKLDQPFFIYYPTLAVHAPLFPTKEFEGKSEIGPYGDFILQLDDFVGRLTSKLDELGIADNTIVIFASDNGCAVCVDVPRLQSLGHNPSYIYRGIKTDIWEGGHRIPFAIRWSGHIQAHTAQSSTACLTDLYATFADLLELPLMDCEGEDSYSLLPLWSGEQDYHRTYIVHHSVRGCYSIRQGFWKLELCPDSGGVSSRGMDLTGMPPIQLYDLQNDPCEQVNVEAEHPEIVSSLSAILADCIRNGRSTEGSPQKNTAASDWPGLWWMDQTFREIVT